MTTINSDYSEITSMANDLFFLDTKSDESDEARFEPIAEFVYANDLAFALAKLITVKYLDVTTLSEQCLSEIAETWEQCLNEGFFNGDWFDREMLRLGLI